MTHASTPKARPLTIILLILTVVGDVFELKSEEICKFNDDTDGLSNFQVSGSGGRSIQRDRLQFETTNTESSYGIN